jgi:hypothetical protein
MRHIVWMMCQFIVILAVTVLQPVVSQQFEYFSSSTSCGGSKVSVTIA